jgi:hypothetical protein
MSARLDAARAELDRFRAQRVTTLFESPVDETSATKRWHAHALEAIRRAAAEHRFLTVDQVHEHLTEPTYDLRALGAAMRAAARAGLIRRVPGDFRTSQRAGTHGRPLAVWESLIATDAQLTLDGAP